MSAPVDVQFRAPVDVFDACLRGQPVLLVEAHHARAAVAELIERANALLAATGRVSTHWPVADEKRIAWNALNVALRAAVGADPYGGTTGAAVDAALARCKGDAA